MEALIKSFNGLAANAACVVISPTSIESRLYGNLLISVCGELVEP